MGRSASAILVYGVLLPSDEYGYSEVSSEIIEAIYDDPEFSIGKYNRDTHEYENPGKFVFELYGYLDSEYMGYVIGLRNTLVRYTWFDDATKMPAGINIRELVDSVSMADKKSLVAMCQKHGIGPENEPGWRLLASYG